MSLWLSGANRAANTVRAHATARAKRETAAALAEGTRQAAEFWAAPLKAKPPRRKKRR